MTFKNQRREFFIIRGFYDRYEITGDRSKRICQ